MSMRIADYLPTQDAANTSTPVKVRPRYTRAQVDAAVRAKLGMPTTSRSRLPAIITDDGREDAQATLQAINHFAEIGLRVCRMRNVSDDDKHLVMLYAKQSHAALVKMYRSKGVAGRAAGIRKFASPFCYTR